MIVSLNIPEDLIAFIDQKATDAKQSRSAWMTDALQRMQVMDSPAGRKGFAHLLLGVMADGALRSGQPLERVRKLFPDFERPPVLPEAPSAPMLPAAANSATAPTSQSVTVSRRRPYQRAGKPLPALMCPKDSRR